MNNRQQTTDNKEQITDNIMERNDMTIEHTHSFILFNTQGTEHAPEEITRLNLKIHKGQCVAMARRAINLYIRKFGAIQIQQGSSLFIFPTSKKEEIAQLETWIVANNGNFVVFDCCGDRDSIAKSLFSSLNDEIDELDRLWKKMAKQKKQNKTKEQINDIENILLHNEIFLTQDQKDRIESIKGTK